MGVGASTLLSARPTNLQLFLPPFYSSFFRFFLDSLVEILPPFYLGYLFGTFFSLCIISFVLHWRILTPPSPVFIPPFFRFFFFFWFHIFVSSCLFLIFLLYLLLGSVVFSISLRVFNTPFVGDIQHFYFFFALIFFFVCVLLRPSLPRLQGDSTAVSQSTLILHSRLFPAVVNPAECCFTKFVLIPG